MTNQNKLLFWVFFSIGLCSCSNQEGGEKIEEILSLDNQYSEIIRMPISASGKLDTVNIAKFAFESSSFHFGETKEGNIVEKEFHFENTGNLPLIITNATSTCGCTVPKYPDLPIPPGGKGSILVKFDTQNKRGYQNKPITVYANTYPNKTTLTLEGKVIP
jgi:hypothetical protein